MCLFLVIYIVILLFNNVINKFIPTSLIDEISFAIIALIGIIKILKIKRIPKITLKVILISFVICGLGLISTFKYKYQIEVLPIFKDVIMFLKVPLTFAFGLVVFNNIQRDKIIEPLYKIIKIFTVIIFVFGILNIFLPINMDCGVRHGIKTYQFVFSHPTFLVYTLVIFICILFTQKTFSKYIFMNIISLILTCRDKAYIFVVVYILVYMFLLGKKMSWKVFITCSLGIIGTIILYLLSFEKLSTLYLDYGVTTARGALYIYGWQYAIKYFPLGTGLATWGSSISAEYYSKLYYIKHMEYTPGLNPKDISYATDTYWPYIYTQFGFIGMLLYLIVLFDIYRYTVKILKDENRFKWGALLIIAYTFIASIFEGFYTNETGVSTIIILLLLFNNKKDRENIVK